MTGAKLLGMHESVTSPTEYRSRHEVRLMVMPPSWRGATRTTGGLVSVPGGNLRPRPQLPDGVVWGGPGRCWRVVPSRGWSLGHPSQIPRPPPTGRRALAGLQAASRASSPKVMHAASPLPKRRRNRAGHSCFCRKPQERCVRAPSTHPPLFPRRRNPLSPNQPAPAHPAPQRSMIRSASRPSLIRLNIDGAVARGSVSITQSAPSAYPARSSSGTAA